MTRPVRSAWMRLLRFATGGFTLALLVGLAPHYWHLSHLSAGAFRPIGVLARMPQPMPAIALAALWLGTVGLAALFAGGRRLRLVGPALCLSLLILTTYRSCWGVVYHTENLVVHHVWILTWLAFLPRQRWGIVLNCLQLATVATYVIAGYAKLRLGGWAWCTGEALGNQVAFDTLKKASLGAFYSPLAPWALRHSAVFAPMTAATLATEWLAPMALLGGRWAQGWCGMAWLFHAGVLAVLAIAFPYPLSGCGLLCLAGPQGLPRLLKAFKKYNIS